MNNPDATPNGARTPTSDAEVAQVTPDAQTKPLANAARAADMGARAPEVALGWRGVLGCVLVAVTCFQLAYSFSLLPPLMLGYAWALVEMTRAATPRQSFLGGALTGLGIFVPQLGFLWTIFGISAFPLWCVLAFWIGAFVWLGRLARQHFGQWALLLLPLHWIGLEYFRSELYFLRFTWLNMGYAFADCPSLLRLCGGVYGVGAVLMLFACFNSLCWHRRQKRLWLYGFVWPVILWTTSEMLVIPDSRAPMQGKWIVVAGVQLEFPAMLDVPPALDRVLKAYGSPDLLVLSEYTFDGPVPKRVSDWCRQNRKHLLVGGKEDLGDGRYYNTAFVIGPDGEVVFQQAKAVPIQFFKDGLPAPEQRVWNSPWGKLGICICYDSSFTRVTDELIRQGAQALIVPVMDMTDWGAHQHQLHSRIAPVRAAEYRVPVFRICSSGISQLVSRDGVVRASAPFPGQGEIIGGALALSAPSQVWGRLPFDRSLVWLGLASVATTLGLVLCGRLQRNPPSPAAS